MANKHTMGPWRYDEFFHSIQVSGRCDVVDCPVLSSIAQVEDTEQVDSDGRVWTCDGDRDANGQLMATAPLLLQACREAYKFMEEFRDQDGEDLPTAKQIKAAIDEATRPATPLT